jgi:hypothetical protein
MKGSKPAPKTLAEAVALVHDLDWRLLQELYLDVAAMIRVLTNGSGIDDNRPMHYILKQHTKEGLWTSERFDAATLQQVQQAVVAGLLNGWARWAETVNGNFIFGYDGKGKVLAKAPKAP